MKKISCNVYQDILPLYADDVVSPETRQFVREHLDTCPDCRRELELLGRPIRLPSEDARPLEGIRRQWARKNVAVWSLSMALLGVFLLMGLPIFDTAMQYHIQELLGHVEDQWYLILPLAAGSFGLQWWFLHLKKARWLKYALVMLPAAILMLAELSWAMGGWDRIGSSLLWYLSFPVLLGAAGASMLKLTLSQPRWVKRTALALCAVFLGLAMFFFPKRLYDTVDVELEGQQIMMEADECLLISADDLDNLIRFAKVSPCFTAPQWEPERCILVRLNEDYVLAAPYGGTPYIYEYAGPLEDFTGENVRYRVYGYEAMYTELRTSSIYVDPSN